MTGVADDTVSWSARLWRDSEEVFAAILRHPFLTGLADGTLDPAAYVHYLIQDAHYLRDYARALAVVGAKAPPPLRHRDVRRARRWRARC